MGFAARIQLLLHSGVDATGVLRDALPQHRHVMGRQGVEIGLAQARQSDVQLLARARWRETATEPPGWAVLSAASLRLQPQAPAQRCPGSRPQLRV